MVRLAEPEGGLPSAASDNRESLGEPAPLGTFASILSRDPGGTGAISPWLGSQSAWDQATRVPRREAARAVPHVWERSRGRRQPELSFHRLRRPATACPAAE